MRAVLLLFSFSIAFGVLATCRAALAQESFPSRPMRIIVPFAAGASANDAAARTLALGLQQTLGWTVIVENKSGASGVIGMEALRASAPDGYTVSLYTSGFTILPSMQSVPFDLAEDFEPIGIFMTVPFFIFAHPSVPAKDVGELIRHAKANPARLTYAIPGIGQPHHLAMELLGKMTGTQFVVVPYARGIAPALPDLLNGRVHLMVGTATSLAAQVHAGQVNVLGTTGRTRSALLPAAAPVAEAVPGFQVDVWTGFAAPKATPAALVARLNSAFSGAVPAIADRLRASGMEPASGTPDEMRATIRSEIVKWRKLIEEARIRPQ
jgi:tripartite-type tricarboxylate transporter receptor subunit TctC